MANFGRGAAELISLSRLDKWYGGITINEQDTTPGVHLNMEEVDIFESKSFVKPTAILQNDSDLNAPIYGYVLDNNDKLFAVGNNGTVARISVKSNASADVPGSWSTYKTSAYNSNAQSPIAWHQYHTSIVSITHVVSTATVTTDGNHGLASGDTVTIFGANELLYIGDFTISVTGPTTFTYTMTADPGVDASGNMEVWSSYLYYVTNTNQLVRLEDTTSGGTEYLVDIQGSTMSLPGLGRTNDRIAFLRNDSELHILNGQYVSTIDETGIFIPKAFTLPDGWSAVSAAVIGSNMAILSRNVNTGLNTSRVFWWDMTQTGGVLDQAIVPVGGPQIIVNYQEIPFIFCAQNGTLYIYALTSKYPQLLKKLYNVEIETDTQAVIPDATKFIFNDTVYFGLWKTDKTGIYQFGRFDANTNFALILGKRFATTDYSSHIPFSAFVAGPNMYASFKDHGINANVKLEGNNSPTYSSQAVIESIQLVGKTIETVKEWVGFISIAKPLPTGCSISISSRVDDSAIYDVNSLFTLNTSNDQLQNGGVDNTYWRREWSSLYGRNLQVKIAFTSNGNNRLTFNSLSILSHDSGIYG